MRKTSRLHITRSFSISAGWLFADLLLALAMLFLAANTLSVKPPPTQAKGHGVVTPTPKPKPSPTPLPQLELKPLTFTINVDDNGLLSDAQSAKDDVKNQVRARLTPYQKRRAGFVLAYGGAPTDGDVQHAFAVAQKVMDALKTFENDKFVFIKTTYHDPFFKLGDSTNLVTLEVYLYHLT